MSVSTMKIGGSIYLNEIELYKKILSVHSTATNILMFRVIEHCTRAERITKLSGRFNIFIKSAMHITNDYS